MYAPSRRPDGGCSPGGPSAARSPATATATQPESSVPRSMPSARSSHERRRHPFSRSPERRGSGLPTAFDGAGWLVCARYHGWLHGDRRAALADAQWLAWNLALPVREVS